MDQFETGLATSTVLPKVVDDSTKRRGRGKAAALHEHTHGETEGTFGAGPRMRCVDFGWIQSWISSAQSLYGGRATMEYLKKNSRESNAIHVVM